MLNDADNHAGRSRFASHSSVGLIVELSQASLRFDQATGNCSYVIIPYKNVWQCNILVFYIAQYFRIDLAFAMILLEKFLPQLLY